jgi:hypothetical protein
MTSSNVLLAILLGGYSVIAVLGARAVLREWLARRPWSRPSRMPARHGQGTYR